MSFIRAEDVDEFLDMENYDPEELNNDPVRALLRPILSHIGAEADDKVDELDLRAEEEMRLEKRRIVRDQCAKVDAFYERKLRQVDTTKKVNESNKNNEARIAMLTTRESLLQEVFAEAHKDLHKISADKNRYPHIMKGLILQGLLQLLEQEVVLRCRKTDEELVKSSLEAVAEEQKKVAGFATRVTLDENSYLPNDLAGGVELFAREGRIYVSSTLESRLDLIAGQIIPQIRTALFGPNKNRAFFD